MAHYLYMIQWLYYLWLLVEGLKLRILATQLG